MESSSNDGVSISHAHKLEMVRIAWNRNPRRDRLGWFSNTCCTCFDPGTKTSSLRKQMFPLPHRFQRWGARRNSCFRKVQTKQIPNYGANLEWHDVRLVFLFFLHDSKICRTCVGSRSSKSYTFDSSGTNLTPYNGVIFWGVILTPKRSLKNSFSGVKVTPDIEELK